MGSTMSIVGAGAAGIGVGIAIVHAGIESLLIVDRETVGHSFLHGLMRRVSSHHHSQVTQWGCWI